MAYRAITFDFIRHHRLVDEDGVFKAGRWLDLDPRSLPPPPMPPGGVAIILVRHGCVLLGRRAPGTSGEWTWAPPGGKADPEESAEGCARRELLEETGLSAGVLTAAGMVRDRLADGRGWDTLFVAAAWVDGEPRVLEPESCLEWRWFRSDQLPAPLFRPFDLFVSLSGQSTSEVPSRWPHSFRMS